MWLANRRPQRTIRPGASLRRDLDEPVAPERAQVGAEHAAAGGVAAALAELLAARILDQTIGA
jgi:hypothetical protein